MPLAILPTRSSCRRCRGCSSSSTASRRSEPKERAEGASRRSEPKERAEARYSFTGASSQIALTPLAYELYRFGESHEKFDDYRFRVEDGVTAPRDGDGVRVALILAYIEEAWEDRARSITRVKYDHWKKR